MLSGLTRSSAAKRILLRECQSHLTRTGLGVSYTHLIPVTSAASVAGRLRDILSETVENIALTASSKSMYSKGRVVTGHASGGITNNHGEQRTIVRRCCWWSRI